jgi:hypothetical protein
MMFFVSRMYTADDKITEYEAVDGMRIDRGNRSTDRTSAPVPVFPPQILNYLI